MAALKVLFLELFLVSELRSMEVQVYIFLIPFPYLLWFYCVLIKYKIECFNFAFTNGAILWHCFLYMLFIRLYLVHLFYIYIKWISISPTGPDLTILGLDSVDRGYNNMKVNCRTDKIWKTKVTHLQTGHWIQDL